MRKKSTKFQPPPHDRSLDPPLSACGFYMYLHKYAIPVHRGQSKKRLKVIKLNDMDKAPVVAHGSRSSVKPRKDGDRKWLTCGYCSFKSQFACGIKRSDITRCDVTTVLLLLYVVAAINCSELTRMQPIGSGCTQ